MSKIDRDNPINGGEHVREQLSDYMDGLLSSNEREAVRSHLDECAECRGDYVELRATQRLMQNMPALPAPRAFTLTPEMAEQVRKPPFWERLFVPRNAPRLATGSVVAFLLLIVVLASTNGLPSPNSSDGVMRLAVPAASSSTSMPEPAAPKAAAAPTETTAAASASGISGIAGSTSTGGEEQAPAPAAIPSHEAPGSSDSAQAQGTSTDNSSSAGNASITPNTTVANSANGSPTTTTLGAAPPSSDGVISHDKIVVSPATPDQRRAAPSGEDNRTGWVALQLGLLALGLALGVAALIAWRRT